MKKQYKYFKISAGKKLRSPRISIAALVAAVERWDEWTIPIYYSWLNTQPKRERRRA